MSHITVGRGCLIGGSGGVIWSPGGLSWVSSKLQEQTKEAGERRQSPLLLTPVFKRLLNLSFSFIATEEMGSGKCDSQLALAKIAT